MNKYECPKHSDIPSFDYLVHSVVDEVKDAIRNVLSDFYCTGFEDVDTDLVCDLANAVFDALGFNDCEKAADSNIIPRKEVPQ